MNIYLFYHSIVSDWNNGNAHFLRGLVTALQSMEHQVTVYSPGNGWSQENLIKNEGIQAITEYFNYFPHHQIHFYDEAEFDPRKLLVHPDLVIVHEWNHPDVVKSIGEFKKNTGGFALYFHDTHHRSVSAKEEMKQYDLSEYDGVLAFGDIVKKIYLKEKWSERAWTFHEAADTTLFHPVKNNGKPEGHLVWVGNWGDDERTRELIQFIIKPVKDLKLKARFYGVRYPSEAIKELNKAGIEYGGWLPNYKVPEVFSKYRFTVHVPRRPYVESLPGIPTIRPFEAMSCGIPLISSPWNDSSGLFREGYDYLMASDSSEMKKNMQMVINNKSQSLQLKSNGLETIRTRHTCLHRAHELMNILNEDTTEI